MKRLIFLYSSFLLFLLFSYWQLNDKEQYITNYWYLWFGLYSLLASMAWFEAEYALETNKRFISAKNYIYLSVAALLIALIRIWQIDYQAKAFFFDKESPAVNEAGGLLLISMWLLIVSFLVKKR